MNKRVSVVSAQVSVVLSALAGCGGGGGGSEKDLRVAFDYGSQASIYVLSDVAIEPSIAGLDGNTPTCSVRSGKLPTGLRLNSRTCGVSGAPVEVGSFFATVRLEVDGFRGSVEENISLTIVPPVISYARPAGPLTWGEAMTPASPRWVGYAPRSGDTVVYSLASFDPLPAGINLDAQTGVVSGSPVEELPNGAITVVARIERDGSSVQAQGSLLFEVLPAQIVYGEISAVVGQSFAVTPTLPSSLRTGGYTMNFVFNALRSNCNELSGVTVDATTGTLQARVDTFIPICQLEIDWTATKGATRVTGTAIAEPQSP